MRDDDNARSKLLKSKTSRLSPWVGDSYSAFADHSPSTRLSGQQNKSPQVNYDKREGGQQKRRMIEERSTEFFENTQVKLSNNDPARDFHDMRLLKIREVAMILGCSVKDAYNLSYECGLPTRKLRGRVRVLGADLKKWLEGLPAGRRTPV